MKRFILVLIYSIGITAIASESFLVAGFESEQEIAKWKAPTSYVDTSKIKFNSDEKYITEGKGSAFLSFPGITSGEGRWPRLVLKDIPLGGDWSNYDEFSIDVINPGPENVNFRVQFIVEGGGKLGRGWAELTPGKHSFRQALPDALKTMRVVNLLMFQSDPPAAYSMYVDNFQIHLNKEILEEKIAEFFEDDPGNWKAAGLGRAFKKLQKNVKKLQTSKDSSIEKAKSFSAYNKQYKDLKEQRNRNFNAYRIKEFNKTFPGTWGYGVTHSLEKVYRKDFPYYGKVAGIAEISMAKNERESLQVVLRSRKDIENVKLSVSDLSLSEDPSIKISSDSIKIYPVGYVKAPKPPYPREELEWYPDPLLNFMDSFKLDKDVWQPIWIDVRTDFESKAGLYSGKIIVEGDKVSKLEIPFLVRVWNFSLPKQNTIPVVIAHGNPTWFYKKNVKDCDLDKIVIDAEDMLLRHRITPSPIYNAQKAVTAEDALRWREKGGKEFNIIYVQPRFVQKHEPYTGWARKRVLNLLADSVPKLRAAGVLEDAYIYSFDEIQEQSYYSAQTILKEVKELYPDIPIVTTAFDESFGINSGLEDCVDIWVPGERSYVKNRERIDEIRKQGKKVWYYTCMYRKGMNFLLEASASAPRLLVGLNQYKEKSDGFLYYQTTSWKSDIIVESGPLTEHNSRGYQAYNGDGVLLYPGRNGVIPTIRLKAIGDGLEDLEYWFLLENLQKSDIKLSAKDRRTLTALLKMNKEVVQSFQIFDFKGDKLQAERIAAGELLSKYAK